jgi:hypothetical protein
VPLLAVLAPVDPLLSPVPLLAVAQVALVVALGVVALGVVALLVVLLF